MRGRQRDRWTPRWMQVIGTCVCAFVLSHAEQLVLYLKTVELLSAAIQTAMERVQQGKLHPSTTVKQGPRQPGAQTGAQTETSVPPQWSGGSMICTSPA